MYSASCNPIGNGGVCTAIMVMKLFLLFTGAFLYPVVAPAQTHREELSLADDFNAISVFGPFQVTLVPAGRSSVVMEYQTVSPADVIAGTDKGILVLRLRNRSYLKDMKANRSIDYVKVTVYYRHLDEIKVQAAAEVSNEVPLKARNLLVESSMGAIVRLKVIAKNLYVKCNMGSQTTLAGRTSLLEVKAGMGAVLQAEDMRSEICKVKAAMGAELDLQVTEELNVQASTGAVVNYRGNPRLTETTLLLGADVLRQHN